MTARETPSPDRRQFLTAALAATAGSVATGSALALINRPRQGAAPLPSSLPQPPAAPAAAAPVQAASPDMLARLATAEAENTRLRAALDAAERRLSIAEGDGEAAGGEIELLRGELASANSRAGLLAGLVALFEQLETVDVEGTVSKGINRVAGYFADLALELPELTDSLMDGELALDWFEEELPALVSARSWLGEQLGRLALTWDLVNVVLRETLEKVDPVLDLIQAWFDKLLGWVPFEWGRRARGVMSALFGLMEETPRTIEGGQREVMVSLDKWFKPEAGQADPAIRTRLFTPLRERTIRSARRAVDQVGSVQKSFQQDLVAEMARAAADRQEIRRQITRYRQEKGI